MNSISQMFALLAAMSIAVERVVEVIKGIVPKLAQPWTGSRESWRRVLLQLISVAAGGVIASQIHTQIVAAVPSLASSSDSGHWGVDVLFGLLASGGSGLWNHVLDITRAIKVDKELKNAEKSPETEKPAALAEVGAKA
jgi:hypothetical protein